MEAQERSLPAHEGTAEALRVLMPSPIGPLGIELLSTVVTRLWIAPAEPVLSTLVPLRKLEGSEVLDEVFGHLSEYFAGARRKLELEFDLGPSNLNPIARRVLKEVCRIPYGKTRSFAEVADSSGRSAAGQVLGVLQENPIPILIPCHRVLTDESGLGSYVGGTDRKRWLLDLESQATELV